MNGLLAFDSKLESTNHGNERVRTLLTEPMEAEMAKSNPLGSFINIGQRGRM